MDILAEIIKSTQLFLAQMADRAPYFVMGLLVMIAFLIGAAWVRSGVERLLKSAGRRANVALVFGRLARWATAIAGILLGLMVMLPGFSPAELLASLGIASVAIGFAFKDILQNFLAGLLLLLTAPIEEGDRITISGHEGTIESIYTRATYLRTDEGRLVLIPNTTLFTNPITVHAAEEVPDQKAVAPIEKELNRSNGQTSSQERRPHHRDRQQTTSNPISEPAVSSASGGLL